METAITQPACICTRSSEYTLWLLAWCFGETLDSESGAVSDSFACLGDPFPPTGLPHSALMWGLMPGLIVSCYAMFNWYYWRPVLWWEIGTGDNSGGEGRWGRLGGVEGSCGQVVWYERRTNKNVKKRRFHLLNNKENDHVTLCTHTPCCSVFLRVISFLQWLLLPNVHFGFSHQQVPSTTPILVALLDGSRKGCSFYLHFPAFCCCLRAWMHPSGLSSSGLPWMSRCTRSQEMMKMGDGFSNRLKAKAPGFSINDVGMRLVECLCHPSKDVGVHKEPSIWSSCLLDCEI